MSQRLSHLEEPQRKIHTSMGVKTIEHVIYPPPPPVVEDPWDWFHNTNDDDDDEIKEESE
jgi:hypothetical protein